MCLTPEDLADIERLETDRARLHMEQTFKVFGFTAAERTQELERLVKQQRHSMFGIGRTNVDAYVRAATQLLEAQA